MKMQQKIIKLNNDKVKSEIKLSSFQAWHDDSEYFFATRSEISAGDLDTMTKTVFSHY